MAPSVPPTSASAFQKPCEPALAETLPATGPGPPSRVSMLRIPPEAPPP